MNPDGVHYLDNADAYYRGDLAHAFNTLWSPLYPWILGLATHLARPTAAQEFPLAHAVNFLIFLAALGAFHLFLREFLALAERLWNLDDFSQLLIVAVGAAAFLYTTLDFCNLALATPDLLVTGFMFLAAAWLLRLQRGGGNAAALVALGITAGFGYLAKTPFILYGCLCIGICWSILRPSGTATARTAVVLVSFAAVSVPYIAALSHAQGRLTYGDTAKYNVIWHVNGVPPVNWQGGPPESGAPLHPTRQILADPPVFEFAEPIAGTYPPWYDAAYWNDGARIVFRISDFFRAAIGQIRLYEYLIHHRQIAFVTGFFILFFLQESKRAYVAGLRLLWPLLLFALFPFVLYGPVHAENRYLAASFALLWTALFAPLVCLIASGQQRTAAVVTGVMCVLMFVEAGRVVQPAIATETNPVAQIEAAQALDALGAKPGDPVAWVSNDSGYAWARLARVRIIAETSWAGCGDPSPHGPDQWRRVQSALERTPARFVVSGCLPGVTDQPGWTTLAKSGLYALRLR